MYLSHNQSYGTHQMNQWTLCEIQFKFNQNTSRKKNITVKRPLNVWMYSENNSPWCIIAYLISASMFTNPCFTKEDGIGWNTVFCVQIFFTRPKLLYLLRYKLARRFTKLTFFLSKCLLVCLLRRCSRGPKFVWKTFPG